MVNELIHWVIVIFAVLLGSGILYTTAMIIIAIVSPQASNNIEVRFIVRDAKRYFGFLLDKGYKISYVQYISHPLAGWHIEFESADNQLSIILDQQEKTLLVFGWDKSDKRHQIFLEAMIYYLSNKKVFIHQAYNPGRSPVFKGLGKLLKSYIEQIEDYLRNDFEKSGDGLGKLQEDYINLIIQENERRYKNSRS